MKTRPNIAGLALVGAAVFATTLHTRAATFVVDSTANWQAFINVFNLPSDGGAYIYGQTWGVADATAVFSGGTLTLGPNSVNDTNTFWYIGGGGPGAPGNKIVDTAVYFMPGNLHGQSVTFEGMVLENTFASGYIANAFIRDFASDYSSMVDVSVPLNAGPFSITLDIINDPTRNVQIGFQIVGANVWVTDRDPIGGVTLAAIPEPSSFSLIGAWVAGVVVCARRRRRVTV